jgi:hypothetical protein
MVYVHSRRFHVHGVRNHGFLENIQPSVAFESYWKFAFERHSIYSKRLRGQPAPWSDDPILRKHKFTDSFRILDRVSQYLVREVIYKPGLPTEPEEIIFRILLFKLFNAIGAWEALTAGLPGTPTWKDFDAAHYGEILGKAKARGVMIWNIAYTQKPQIEAELKWQLIKKGLIGKHHRYLAVLEHQMRNGVPEKLISAKSYWDAYRALIFPPLYGPFLCMQHVTDLNYSTVLNFDEDEMIIPGPGCLKGIQKCFKLSSVNPGDAQDLINAFVESQEGYFDHFIEDYEHKEPVTLFGQRRLHAIDIQNLFCETDKYSRIAHPELKLKDKENSPKTFNLTGPLPAPFFPPKWGITVRI